MGGQRVVGSFGPFLCSWRWRECSHHVTHLLKNFSSLPLLVPDADVLHLVFEFLFNKLHTPPDSFPTLSATVPDLSAPDSSLQCPTISLVSTCPFDHIPLSAKMSDSSCKLVWSCLSFQERVAPPPLPSPHCWGHHHPSRLLPCSRPHQHALSDP